MALKVGKGDGDQTDDTGVVRLRKRYEISVKKPLPELDSFPAKAYEAVYIRDGQRLVFAYICDSNFPPRLDSVNAIHRINHRCFMRILDWDVLYWPPLKKRCPILICERPHGPKLIESPTATRQPMKEDEITGQFLTPAVQVLRELHDIGIYHGNIRLDNLYMSDVGGAQKIMLGECFVAPALSTIPTAYCTIEKSLCHPLGRGYGDTGDDLYAVGVCLLGLAVGEPPDRKYETDEMMLQTKLTYGSYGALVQRYRISNSLMEPLRGLLNDNPKERWGIEDLFLWIDGRRLSPKQQSMPPKASKAYKFLGRDYGTARELAYGLSNNWDEAVKVLRDGSVDNWLRRSLQDDQRVEAVNHAKNISEPKTPEDADRLAARILMALSVDRPIQMRNFSAALEGVPLLMGYRHKDSEIRKYFIQLMQAGLVAFFLEMRSQASMENLSILNRLDKAKGFLNQKGYGGGVERLAYYMNPGLPCMSPNFAQDYVPNINYLLPALNRYAETKGKDLVSLIDQDIAAYIAVHHNRQITEELREINTTEHDYIAALCEIQIISKLQESSPLKKEMRALCAGAYIVLNPAIERFHSRAMREKVREKAQKSISTGKLGALLAAVNDPEDNQTDIHGFEAACIEYASAVQGQIDLHNDIKRQDVLSAELAGQISSALSGLFAVFIAFGYAVLRVFM